ncbi:MAG: hypothetical protein PHP82_00315 [Candidatus ainarchaeum sp.]|nr:hypothetical protein [Candidatus ainarchaeum sp.]
MDKKKVLLQLEFLRKKSLKMRLAAEEWDSDWKILVSIIMSAQSRDETTIIVANSLFKKYSTLKKLSKANYFDVLKVFKSLNYNKTKAKNVINCAKILLKDYDCKVPMDFNKLINLPGVGRKTANVFLSEKGKDTIGVDTHLSYVSQYLNWSKHKNPVVIERDLKNLFPKNYWRLVNPVVVRFGKSYTNRKEKNKILDCIKKIK